ncbi:MFS transporter [Elizabethkingia meningoseptica]|uniref:MFS transporter n=1 Tax=Elizabethkingia meningoseptica TaxID=238 RepID=A0A1V3U334_ELIME|nr:MULTISPECIES: MFS transporter [Elizabethkingia]AQX05902.1 MFS transporter [Elizabethkingia meningoseptica]AQX13440.1 MFS transporter [Elizabethkingia meningoseptica]AQX47945.1 MFS transporter [Elizabethkingia meningoseptica]EOR30037.1 signal transducer [Elizabethkingia meningoseptica ATCC 13253 = NBRC 12535]KUY23134.1 MFS transporter [Elizabethkingia meningoseptica]
MINHDKRSNPAFWITTLYFAMGLPFVAISVASTIMYKSMGIPDKSIAFWTSLIMLPWTIKPLWSPILEMFKTKKYFVIFTEIFTAVCFGLVCLSLSLPNYFAYSIAIFSLMAFSGATHDIAADGLYLDTLTTEQQSRYIGWQGAAYNVAKVLTSGVIIYFAGVLEKIMGIKPAWTIIMLIYGGIMLIIGLLNMRKLPSGASLQFSDITLKQRFKELLNVFANFFTKKHIIYYIFFIILYRFAEGFAVKIVPLFLKAERSQGGLGLSTKEIGLVYGTAGAIAFIAGSLISGLYVSKRGLKKSLFTLCCIFNFPYIVYVFLACWQPDNVYLIAAGIVVEYFGYGFGFVGIMLFMMQQIAPVKYKMANYAFATGIMNLGVMLPGMMSGYISDMLGYRNFFIFVLFATIPALLITYFVPFTYNDNSEELTN